MENIFTHQTEIIPVILLAVILSYLPKIGRVFKGFNTMIHESGHAIMSLLFSGEVVSIDIFYSGEGVATTKSKSGISHFFISIAGYPFASLIAFASVYAVSTGRYEYLLYFFISMALINLVFWVRNLYGIIWLCIVIVGVSLMFYYDADIIKKWTALIITALISVDAWVSSWHILYLSFKQPKKAGDAQNLHKIAFLPAFFWGLFFWIQASFFILLSIHLYYPLSFLQSLI